MIRPDKTVESNHAFKAIAPAPIPGDFFIGAYDGSIFHYTKGELRLKSQEDSIMDHGMDASRNFLVAVRRNKTLKIFNLQTNTEITCAVTPKWIHCPRISPDESIVVTPGEDHLCRIWDTATGEQQLCYARHTRPVECVVFSPWSTEVFSAGGNGIVHKWNMNTGITIAQSPRFSQILTMAISGNILATGHYPGRVNLLDATTLTRNRIIREYYGGVINLSFLDEKYLVSVSQDQRIMLLDVESGEKIARLKGVDKIDTCSSCFSSKMFAAVSKNGTMEIYNIPLRVFIFQNNIYTEKVKTVQSFFYAFKDYIDPTTGFNVDDYDNFFLMRILMNIK